MKFSLRYLLLTVTYFGLLFAALTSNFIWPAALFQLLQAFLFAMALTAALKGSDEASRWGASFVAGVASWYALLVIDSWPYAKPISDSPSIKNFIVQTSYELLSSMFSINGPNQEVLKKWQTVFDVFRATIGTFFGMATWLVSEYLLFGSKSKSHSGKNLDTETKNAGD